MPPHAAPPLIGDLPLGGPLPGENLQRWLYRALRQAMLDGRLPGDSMLPGSRTLAAQHGLARGTVQAAYDQLLSEGYLIARRGSGTRVSQTLPDRVLQAGHPQRQPRAATAPLPSPAGPWIKRLDALAPAFPLRAGQYALQPFQPHRCDVDAFPMDLWRKLHIRHLRDSRREALWDSEPAGQPALREAISAHLAIARGVAVAPEHIVVISSVQQALDLCLRLLVGPGDAVWMEDPGYPGARQVMLASGARVVDVPVDPQGMRVADAVVAAPGAKLAYVTPSRQAPMGVALSPERRLALLQWAAAHQACIFEDDYDSEYRFVARPIPALKSLPLGDTHVVLAGTFSKLMFPALRVAFVALPAHLVEPFVCASSLTARNANGLSQAVLSDFMADGHFDRHVRRMRKIYAGRAQAFEDAAATHWKGLIEVPAAQAGLDVVGRLLTLDENTAARRLAKAGLMARPLGLYTSTNRLADALVMGFGAFDEARIHAAAKAVALALQKPD